MGFFKSKLTQEEYDEWMRKASCSFDSISGATAEISFGPSQISLADCDGNSKEFEAEEVPTSKNHLGGQMFIYGKAKQAVIKYMKENGYRFVNSGEKEIFMNFNYEDNRTFSIEKE
ncbi:hypothetical protein [uncultured Treponema sp.]|uniref:hypothetical protein n=1 Tax=uncultured Treponema sp. TaxID=162155 RepID=UPI0025F763A1|nr:hypothetical protein [uncultured Treponema sp.]